MPLPAPPNEKPAEMANSRARGWPVVHREVGFVGIGLLFRGTLGIVVGFTLRGTRGATP
jgi:hypothetical protein